MVALHRVANTGAAHQDVEDFRESTDAVDWSERAIVATDVLAFDALACELQEAHRRKYDLGFD